MIQNEDKYGFQGVSLRNENHEVAVVLFGVFINIVSKLTEAELEETGGKLSTDKAHHFFLIFSRQ